MEKGGGYGKIIEIVEKREEKIGEVIFLKINEFVTRKDANICLG